ncbi:hypothetical protein X742_33050 [Mesorhizobium sp. LNHC232B00]|nr:hypothetical protein X742_33050 [Mesorhizobium sp. LNHC232B00]
MAPYIQFVGRILRVTVQNSPGHPDNYGHVVTHAGMNLDERLREFKLFESDDQKFWEDVIGGKVPEPPAEVKSGEARMKLSEGVVVNYEIVDSLIEEQFTSAEQEDIIKELRENLERLGLDPDQADAIVLARSTEQKTSRRSRIRNYPSGNGRCAGRASMTRSTAPRTCSQIGWALTAPGDGGDRGRASADNLLSGERGRYHGLDHR